jgi:hypothetical protein
MSDVRIAEHPSEASGHWYTRTGEQILEVPSADGKRMVKTTLRHARKMNLVPGVTTILRMADKPTLNAWREEQMMLAALTLPRLNGESEAAWVKRVKLDAAAHAAQAAALGTDIHAAIEYYMLTSRLPEERFVPHVYGVQALLLGVFGSGWEDRRRGAEAGCASHYGYGTKVDLFFPADWIIDFKSCDGSAEELEAKITYDEHAMQLAATREALAETVGSTYRASRCAIVYVSRSHPGAARMVAVSRDELARGLEMFLPLLQYWKAKNRYESGWTLQGARP